MRHVKTNRSTLDGFLLVFSSLILSGGQRAQLLHVCLDLFALNMLFPNLADIELKIGLLHSF